MGALEIINHKGYTIEIHADYHAANPIQEWDGFAHFACWHRRYNLGNTGKEFPTPKDYHEFCKEAQRNGGIVELPLWLYDHSGLSIATVPDCYRYPFTCRWDAGQVGYIYWTKKEIREAYRWRRISKKRMEKVIKDLQGQVRLYNSYLAGQVYAYIVNDPGGERVDSCWGFYGYDERQGYMMEEAKGVVERTLETLRDSEWPRRAL